MPTIESCKNVYYIEHVIADAYANAIYRSKAVSEWLSSIGEEIIDFGGGVKAIAVKQIASIPIEVLRKVRYYDKRNKRRRVTPAIAKQIKEAFTKSLALEP